MHFPAHKSASISAVITPMKKTSSNGYKKPSAFPAAWQKRQMEKQQ
jgi:hypothetical protein